MKILNSLKIGRSTMKRKLGVPSKSNRVGGQKIRKQYAELLKKQRNKEGSRTFNAKIKYQGNLAN